MSNTYFRSLCSLRLRTTDLNHHSREEQPEEGDSSSASLPFFWFCLLSCHVFVLRQIFLETQYACNFFRYQSKAINIQGQQRGTFLSVSLIKSEKPLQKHLSRLQLLSHCPGFYHRLMQTIYRQGKLFHHY